MLRLLPFILIPVLVLAGLGYFRYVASKPSLSTVQTQDSAPIEVPKTLPEASIEDKVKALEDIVSKIVVQLNSLKSSASQLTNTPTDSKLNTLDAQVTELKARISALEKATPLASGVSSSNSTVYIPLGSGGGPWGNQDWYSTPEYQISLDPSNYPGYSGMYLEVTFRLTEAAGTGSVRLYNSTDSSVTSGQVDSTSNSYLTKTSSSFKLPSGSKNYTLQIKSTEGKDLLIQTARIKVNF